MEQRRAWLYTRIDAPENSNGLLKGQKKELSEYAAALGLKIFGTNSDRGVEPQSDRPGPQSLLAAAANHKMDVVITVSPHCIARDDKERRHILHTLAELGVSVYTPAMFNISCR